jgi:hypothetical protein
MARIVLTNVDVTVAGVNLSDYISSISLSSTYDAVETTAFGGGNVPAAARTRQAGLVDNAVTLDFHQDFAAGQVEATIYPLLGTVQTVEVQPVNAAISVDSPKYIFSALISEWTPVNGGVGELATASVTWPISGAIVKDVTP